VEVFINENLALRRLEGDPDGRIANGRRGQVVRIEPLAGLLEDIDLRMGRLADEMCYLVAAIARLVGFDELLVFGRLVAHEVRRRGKVTGRRFAANGRDLDLRTRQAGDRLLVRIETGAVILAREG